MPLVLIGAAQTRSTHYGDQVVERGINFVVDYNVVEFGDMTHFPARTEQPSSARWGRPTPPR